MKVEAVVFDLFETLISEFSDGKRKVPREKRDYEKLLRMPNERFREEWGKRTQMRMAGEFDHFSDVVRDIMQANGLEADEPAIEMLYRERLEEKAVPFRDTDEAVFDMLRQLKERDIKVGLISNCTEEEVRAWETSPFPAYFDEVVFSYQVRLAKPDPRIYELACSRLGVQAQRTLFVGDGGSNELDGASRVGMIAYQATWFVPERFQVNTGFQKLSAPGEVLQALHRHETKT